MSDFELHRGIRVLNRSVSRVARTLVAGVLVLAGTSPISPSFALEKLTVAQGLSMCLASCKKESKSKSAEYDCNRYCEVYWRCNGANATETECEHARDMYGIQSKPTTGLGGTVTHLPRTSGQLQRVYPSGNGLRSGPVPARGSTTR